MKKYLNIFIVVLVIILAITIFTLMRKVKPPEIYIQKGAYLEAISAIVNTFDTASPDYANVATLYSKFISMPIGEVVSIFQQAMNKYPSRIDILRIGLGYIYATKNEPDKAIKEFDAIQNDPKNLFWRAVKYEGLGSAYLSKGLVNRAINEFEKAISADPDYPLPYLRLGDIYYHNLKDIEKAKEYYTEYLRVNPKAENKEQIEKIIR